MAAQPSNEALLREYYEILHIVDEFDRRLLTVKGWGVTLSLAALAWGFQYAHYGLFLVAALSGLGFWIIEGTMKRHQMRYYPRMREIEVLQYERLPDEAARSLSSPRIDSGWSQAGESHIREEGDTGYRPERMEGPRRSYRLAWFLPHVLLPHVVSLVAGLVLLYLASQGTFGDMSW